MYQVYTYENGIKQALSVFDTHAEYVAEVEDLLRNGFEAYGDTSWEH